MPSTPPNRTLAEIQIETSQAYQPSLPEQTGALPTLPPGAGIISDAVVPPWLPQQGEDAQHYVAFMLWAESNTPVPGHALAKQAHWELRKQAWHQAIGPGAEVGSDRDRDEQSLRILAMVKSVAGAAMVKHLVTERITSHANVSFKDAVAALKQAVILERLIGGLPTERIELDYSGLSEVDFAELVRLHEKASTR